MDKEQIRKEFNQFVDSASEESLSEFLAFMRNRKKSKTTASQENFKEDKASKKSSK